MAEESRAASGTLRIVRDDLTKLDLDAFVHYAQHDLVLGAGFGSAITVRGGPTIQAELKEHGPVETCDVVVSKAGELKARHILHAVGPRFSEEDVEGKLRRTMQNVLAAADEAGIESLGFPPMGAGFYGIPLDDCARVMIEEIERHLAGDTSLKDVRICTLDHRELTAFDSRLAGGEA